MTADEVRGVAGDWGKVFGRVEPLWLEIGPGNGFFLASMARLHPHRNIVGLELRYKRVWMCTRKILATKATNVRVGHYHAGFLPDVFRPSSLDGIWINHPDPWPKDRHERNRLLNSDFAKIIALLLKQDAQLELRSDHMPYRDLAAQLLPPLGFTLEKESTDLARTRTHWPDYAQTNYERKKTEAGIKVFAQRWRAPGMDTALRLGTPESSRASF